MPLHTEQYRVLDHSSHAAAKQRDARSPGRLLLSFVIEGGCGYRVQCYIPRALHTLLLMSVSNVLAPTSMLQLLKWPPSRVNL